MSYRRARLFLGTPPAGSVFYFPGADITLGNWTPSAGGTLFGVLDEATPNDADYDASGLNPSSDSMEIQFVGGVAPVSTAGHILSYRIKADGITVINVSLYDPVAGLIQAWSHTPAPTSWTQFDQSVSPANVANITDYSRLAVLVEAVTAG